MAYHRDLGQVHSNVSLIPCVREADAMSYHSLYSKIVKVLV